MTTRLVPATPVALNAITKGVDARDKPGHDERETAWEDKIDG
jgi:hypothetical protein